MQLEDGESAPGLDVTGKTTDFEHLARGVLEVIGKRLGSSSVCVRRCSGHWFVWDGIGYVRKDAEGMGIAVRVILQGFWHRTPDRPGKPGEPVQLGHRKRLCPVTNTVNETMAAMAALPGVSTDEQPDQNHDEIVCEPGRINLKTGELIPHTADVFSTRRVGIGYPKNYSAGLAADEGSWLAYLASLELDEATLRYLRRAFGYALTGRGCEKSLFFLHGKKNTSKTTLLRIVMRVLGRTTEGGYAAETDAGDWVENRNSTGASHTDSLIGVEGARVVFCDETGENARLNEARIKRAFGGSGSTIRMSAKGEKGRDVPIRFAMFFASNHLPCSSDEATQDRLKLITHTKVVDSPEPGFIDRFLTPGMRQAVFMWLVRAAGEYIAEGLGAEPPSVLEQRAEFARDNDTLGAFLRERVGRRINLWQSDEPLKCRDISVELARWSKENGSGFRISPNRLPRMVAERTGVSISTMRGGWKAFQGLALLNDSEGYPREGVVEIKLVGD